jgi:hypothetical protein
MVDIDNDDEAKARSLERRELRCRRLGEVEGEREAGMEANKASISMEDDNDDATSSDVLVNCGIVCNAATE